MPSSSRRSPPGRRRLRSAVREDGYETWTIEAEQYDVLRPLIFDTVARLDEGDGVLQKTLVAVAGPRSTGRFVLVPPPRLVRWPYASAGEWHEQERIAMRQGVAADPGIGHAEAVLRHDARAARDLALRALEDLAGQEDASTYQRWLSVKGAAQARLGETEEGARVLREVRAWAEEHDETELLALTHRRLSALFRRVGDPTLMLEHAVTAVELLADDADDRVRADHVLGLADALGAGGSYEEALARYDEAARLADSSGDRFLQVAVLNNLAYTQYEAGRADLAVATAEQLLAETTEEGRPLLHLGDTVARIYLAVGRYAEAEEVLAPLCRAADAGQDCDGLVLGLLTLTEVRRLRGQYDEAADALAHAQELVARYSLTGRRAEAMRAEAELHAARGDFERAYETFRRFHDADLELRAWRRDVHARTMNAIFQATEAQRSSDHFRELSVRDPLTGLHNRRHLDDRLAELLAAVATDGSRLTIGLVDLDHFKRINDTRSHAVGDEVLRTVAGLLQRAAGRVDDGLAVRMGGEEFLVLLPGLDPVEARERLDALRREIAGFSWDALTDGLPVTASIGAATAPDDARGRSALLELADANLYRAKGEGRDRLVG